jgi:hypothetical protein
LLLIFGQNGYTGGGEEVKDVGGVSVEDGGTREVNSFIETPSCRQGLNQNIRA